MTLFRWLAGLILVLGSTGAAGAAPKAPPSEAKPSRHSLTYDNRLAGRLNPLGATDQLRLRYRYRLFDSQHILLKDTFLGTFAAVELTPSFFRFGGGVEAQPVAFLRLTALVEWGPWFSTIDSVLSFDSPRAEHSDTELDRLGDQGERYWSTALFVTLSALLRFKVGPVALLSELKFVYSRMKVHDGHTVWWDPILDALLPAEGWALNNDTTLAWIFKFGLIVGVRYTLTHVFYRDTDYLPGEPTDNLNTPTHRLGPLVAYRFKYKKGAFEDPALALIINWWITHRYRTGQDVHQAFPYIALAFSFQGRFL